MVPSNHEPTHVVCVAWSEGEALLALRSALDIVARARCMLDVDVVEQMSSLLEQARAGVTFPDPPSSRAPPGFGGRRGRATDRHARARARRSRRRLARGDRRWPPDATVGP